MEANFENVAYDWEMLVIELYKTVNKKIRCGFSGYVIMQLINSHFIYQKKKKNNENFSWDDTFKLVVDRTFKKKAFSDLNKLTVTSISQSTGIPLETVRRKVFFFQKKRVIKITKKGIQHDTNFKTYWEKIAFNEVKLLHIFINNISKNGGIEWINSREAIKKMNQNQ
ncbi:hypothetical protein OA848_05705 [Rickettsiales bacterium]|nr:hypothetical protein [Rickettsiales bacterium]